MRSFPSATPRRLRQAHGFTLVEVMVAAAVLVIAVVGFYAVFGAANQLAYAARVNTSARIQLESALSQVLTEPWRSEQDTNIPIVLQDTNDQWVRFNLPGEQNIGTPPTNVSLQIDPRRTDLISSPVIRGVLERKVKVDDPYSITARRVSFRLSYGGTDAPLGLRTARPVTMIVHTFRSRDN